MRKMLQFGILGRHCRLAGIRPDHAGPGFKNILIKTCWGGRSLHGNFRPPSAGKPAYETGCNLCLVLPLSGNRQSVLHGWAQPGRGNEAAIDNPANYFEKEEKDFPKELMLMKAKCVRETIREIEAATDSPELIRIK
jgi:hypothetical protein